MQKEKAQQPNRSIKTRFYLSVLLVGLALTGWSLFQDKNLNFNIFENAAKQKEASSMDKNSDTGPASVIGNYLDGQLQNSDDLSRGNLKLTSPLGEIYIRTARDFSALIGFDVLMTIDGTLGKFILLNIEKRVEKDGYIQAQ